MEQHGQKSSKSRRETSVQGTNDSSIVSKCSTSACGYFDDKFLHHFVAKQSRRAPLIHRGYYIRAKAFDKVFKMFLAENSKTKSQIISLGCGFDSTYFRLKDAKLLQDTTFYEIDFPDLVKRKHKTIECKEALMELLEKKDEVPLSPHIEMSCVGYYLLGVDLTQLNTLEAALKMCGIDFEIPTLLFSECVMTYMTRRCSTDVVKWAAETFEQATFAMYEQINPDDAFGLFMQHHFHSIGSPLKCIKAFPTLESQKERFIKNGWTKCELVDMNTFYHQCLSSDERRIVENLEAFDEYEELNLKYSHYFMLVASTNNPALSYLKLDSESQDFSQNPASSGVVSIEGVPSSNFVCRFGHASSLVSERFVITTGGFGEVDGRHQRLTDITVTDLNSLESCHIPCVSSDVQYSRMHHTSVLMSDRSTYLIAGRQSPYFMCSQMLRINLELKDKTNTLSNSSHTTTAKCDDNNGCIESEHLDTKVCNVDVCDSSGVKNNTIDRSGNKGEESNTKSPVLDCENDASTALQSWDFPFGTLHVEVVEQSGDVPPDRWRHAATAVNIDGIEKIFLHGGKTKSGEILNDAYIFDPASKEWSQMTCHGEVPGPRHSHNALFWKKYVILTGGLDNKQVPLKDIFLLDLTTGIWERLVISGQVFARYSHTAEIIGDRLVLIGGIHLSHPPPGVTIVNLESRAAVDYALPSPDKSNLLMLHRITSVKLDSGQILIFGGGGNCFSFGTHLNRTPVILNVTSLLDTVH